jgi:hypothetical protein
MLTFGLNGLNWHVQVLPNSLEMVSTPVGPDELDEVELVLHAAASRPEAIKTPRTVRRLIAVALRIS